MKYVPNADFRRCRRMGLPISKLIIATNENDILHRFWQTGAYEKQGVHSASAEGLNAHGKGVKETLSPAMDILISSFSGYCGLSRMTSTPLEWMEYRKEDK